MESWVRVMPREWQSILAEVVDLIEGPLAQAGIAWSLAGSAATSIQGCAVIPRDIDLLLNEAEGVDALANLMEGYAPRVCDAEVGSEAWLSTLDKPIADQQDSEGFHWHWGRWLVRDFKVEGAHIRAPDGWQGGEPGIWENGPEVWTLHRLVGFEGHRIRVPPLEVQLATCARRGLYERVEAITRVLRREGVDYELLKRSLSDPQLKALLDQFPI